jgi:probable F420-dependent oxidoreductase
MTGEHVKIGAILPQTDLPPDVGALTAWAEAVEGLGYTHVVAFDHILGADPEAHAPWTGGYDIHSTFHEVMVVFGFLAGRTNLSLATGVMVLPQRNVSLVAKQAAELDLLTRGGFRLGVGVGWNEVESRSVGYDFTTRGRRMNEQIEVLRRLWQEPVVAFDGEFTALDHVGLAPRPTSPIPIWIGGASPAALRRVARLGDGWFAPPGDFAAVSADWEKILSLLEEEGRPADAVGCDVRLMPEPGAVERIGALAQDVTRMGATHLSVSTARQGLRTVDEHIAVLTEAAEVLDLSPVVGADAQAR